MFYINKYSNFKKTKKAQYHNIITTIILKKMIELMLASIIHRTIRVYKNIKKYFNTLNCKQKIIELLI